MNESLKRLIVFDTETSGVFPKLCQILTLDAIAVECGQSGWQQVGKPFHGQIEIMPDMRIDAEALRVNGIDRQFWQGEREGIVLRAFCQWAKDNCQSTYNLGVGYNVRFDIDFLRAAFARHPALKYTNALSYTGLDLMQVVLMNVVTGAMQPPENLKLTTVCEALGIDTSDAHNSAADVRMTFDLLKAVYALSGGGQQSELFPDD
jgi:DNA polymerase III subunit epsilon